MLPPAQPFSQAALSPDPRSLPPGGMRVRGLGGGEAPFSEASASPNRLRAEEEVAVAMPGNAKPAAAVEVSRTVAARQAGASPHAAKPLRPASGRLPAGCGSSRHSSGRTGLRLSGECRTCGRSCPRLSRHAPARALPPDTFHARVCMPEKVGAAAFDPARRMAHTRTGQVRVQVSCALRCLSPRG